MIPTPETVRAILDGAEGTRYHVPLTLAAAAGLRRGEALGLRWRDVPTRRGHDPRRGEPATRGR